MNETDLNNQNQKEQSQKEQRQQKLEKLKATGVNVYPYSYKPDYTIQEVLEKADSLIQTEQPESAEKIGKSPAINCDKFEESHFKIEMPKKITRTAILIP